MRGYKIVHREEEWDGDELTLKGKIREEMVQKLAADWNDYRRKIEHRSWRSQEDIDNEADYHAEMAEQYTHDEMIKYINRGLTSFTEDEYEDSFSFLRRENLSDENRERIKSRFNEFVSDYYAEQKKKGGEDALRIQVIEELLSDLGARMMRAYEHYNEEERIMEYLERDRGYE